MKINKSECPIVHFFYVGKNRSGYLLDKFTEALRSGMDEYTAIDLYLVQLLPESECEAIPKVSPTLVLKPRDVISIEDSEDVDLANKTRHFNNIQIVNGGDYTWFARCIKDFHSEKEGLNFYRGKLYEIGGIGRKSLTMLQDAGSKSVKISLELFETHFERETK